MRTLRSALSAMWKRLTRSAREPYGDFGGPGVEGREPDVEVDEATVDNRKPGSVGRITHDDEGDDQPPAAEARQPSTGTPGRDTR